MRRLLLALACTLALSQAEAALLGRAPENSADDFRAYYDDVLDITWLSDTRLGDQITVYPWDIQRELDYLNQTQYLGASNWRLPQALPVDGQAWNQEFSYDGSTDWAYNLAGSATRPHTNELAHLYYVTLGNPGAFDPDGNPTPCADPSDYCPPDVGPFIYLADQRQDFWTNAFFDDPEEGQKAVIFDFVDGLQSLEPYGNNHVVWAVRDGDILPTPAPGGLWLLLTGVLGLAGGLRRAGKRG